MSYDILLDVTSYVILLDVTSYVILLELQYFTYPLVQQLLEAFAGLLDLTRSVFADVIIMSFAKCSSFACTTTYDLLLNLRLFMHSHTCGPVFSKENVSGWSRGFCRFAKPSPPFSLLG